MFRPYKKLAKLSLKRARLSCIHCKCMKLASKSAIESDSSAKDGSNDSRGAWDGPPMLDLPDSRKDEREDGRNGVVGRDVGLRLLEPDRLVLLSRGVSEADIVLAKNHPQLREGQYVLCIFCVEDAVLTFSMRDAILRYKVNTWGIPRALARGRHFTGPTGPR